MIRPFDNCEPPPPVAALSYETVLCTELPAFDPVPTLRSVLLKPPHLQRFECFLRKTGWLTMPIYACGLILRIAVCSVPAPIGRLVSPWAAILHIPPCIVFAAGIRVEFETYFRDSRNIAMSAFTEASLLILLMGSISLNIMDDLHHSNLLIAGGHTLSTKDVLVNVIGTMATLMMRTTYRRVKLIKRQKQMEGTATQSLGYRCFIALNPTGPGATSRNSVVPHPLGPLLFFNAQSKLSRKKNKSEERVGSRRLSSFVLPPLQIHLVKDSRRYDPRDTLWSCVGSIEALHKWQVVVLQVCGVTGFILTIPSIFAPLTTETEVMGVLCLATTSIFYAVSLFCCQRILLKRVVLSFDFLFLILQLMAAHLCLADILWWRWTSTCGVASSYLWAKWSLSIDALTPTMRHRLRIKSWMPTCCIVLFIIIQLLVSLDILVWEYSQLRDRVFWNLDFLGRQAQFRVVTFLWSRVVTIFVWYGRLLYILVTRTHENTLIILRGNVEFDYQTWRLQANIAREVRRMAKFAKAAQASKAIVDAIPFRELIMQF
ncbi:hypothetical protein L914_02067 [Phytophthora nicotianae]|uniref:Uncharacterized protein n=1 Tax=Phytophthora nicotianae TaxID=4792 RepID=W2P1P5_PHYNI|nr:hypothetical protein L914_02067 [Phytophthora nicotianae]